MVISICKYCLKHGANGKWYLNARNYLSKEDKDFESTREYLEILWGNLERVYRAKKFGFSLYKTLDHRLKIPFFGRVIKATIERMLEKENNLNPRLAEGHFGQVIPLEEAKLITTDLADITINALCPCRYTQRGLKEQSCLGFTALAEALPKLPRFIPDNGLDVLDADKAESFLEDINQKGKVHTIWSGPIPYIAAICSCEYPQCIGLRARLDFGINVVLKGEYIAVVDPNKCIGCNKCTSRCQFGAINFSSTLNRPIIDAKRCFGCGLCKESCEQQAITLTDRNEIPIIRGIY